MTLANHLSDQADENLRLIRSSLPDAVEACIDAAGYEFDISQQRALLRSASYGQAFCRFVEKHTIVSIFDMILVKKQAYA